MVVVGNRSLTEEDVLLIIFGKSDFSLDKQAYMEVDANFHFLRKFARGKVIYGINTGLGPMARYKINGHREKELQYNLIRSHAAGAGDPLPADCVRASMLARLNSFMLARSGVHPEVTRLLAGMLHHDIIPFIPEHGGVGASGDLVQLAHMALNMIGEGDVFYQGVLQQVNGVYREAGLKPVEIHLREGLALINGTSVMTGIGLVNLLHAKNLIQWMTIASCMVTEIVSAYDDHISDELNRTKLHAGQQYIAGQMRNILSDSKLIRRRAEHLYHHKAVDNGSDLVGEKVQEYYSLRCVPQILGPIQDAIVDGMCVLLAELNSVNDNPVIDHIEGNVYHGGNFHGDYVSLEMDKLKIAITRLSMLAERQLNYLMNPRLNEKLPPFVNLGIPGINLGMQGAQFTAVSTVAENQTISYPMYLHSIPNNNDNQDIVSMGTNAAMLLRRVIRNSYQVLAIEMISILQAIDFLGIEKEMASLTREYYTAMRTVVPKFMTDQVRYPEIKGMTTFLEDLKTNMIRS
jgi:histidine ammonia-lyase